MTNDFCIEPRAECQIVRGYHMALPTWSISLVSMMRAVQSGRELRTEPGRIEWETRNGGRMSLSAPCDSRSGHRGMPGMTGQADGLKEGEDAILMGIITEELVDATERGYPLASNRRPDPLGGHHGYVAWNREHLHNHPRLEISPGGTLRLWYHWPEGDEEPSQPILPGMAGYGTTGEEGLEDEEPEDERLGDEELRAVMTMTREKLEALAALGEEFERGQDLLGTTACVVQMIGPLASLMDILKDEEDAGGSLERQEILDEGERFLEGISERADRIQRGRRDTPNWEDQEDETITRMVEQAVATLANNRAMTALVKAAREPRRERPDRWAHCSIAWGITLGEMLATAPTELIAEPGWERTGRTGEAMLPKLARLEAEERSWMNELEEATRELSRLGGLEPSPAMTRTCRIIKTMEEIQEREGCMPGEEGQYNLVSNLMESLTDTHAMGIILRHGERTYIQRVDEPFPEGFPGETAAKAAREILERLPEEEIGLRQAAITAIMAAQAGQHHRSPGWD